MAEKFRTAKIIKHKCTQEIYKIKYGYHERNWYIDVGNNNDLIEEITGCPFCLKLLDEEVVWVAKMGEYSFDEMTVRVKDLPKAFNEGWELWEDYAEKRELKVPLDRRNTYQWFE